MTLRAKTLGVLILTFAGSAVAIYLVSRIVLLGSFESLEKDNAVPNVQRVLNTLSDQIDALDADLSNWVTIMDLANVDAEPEEEFSELLAKAFAKSQIEYILE